MSSSKRKSDDFEGSAEPVFVKGDPLIVTRSKRSNKRANLDAPNKARKEAKDEANVPKEALDGLEKGGKELLPHSQFAAARRYQIEVLEKALQGNTIVYLETGCGKTLIAVLLIKEFSPVLLDRARKVIAVFLAPTVILVEQQAAILKINTFLKVDSFFGAKGVDCWSHEMWQTEAKKNEVLVMTPQVFLDALRHSFLKMENVELLILDECHHAQKSHAYAKIMREYYHTQTVKKPKVFGMTASPVIKKGVSSVTDCAEQMHRLEDLLDAQVYTLKDRDELESYVPTPIQKTKFYDKCGYSFEFLKQKLDLTREKYEQHCNRGRTDGMGKIFKDDEELAKKLRKRIRELHGCLCYCLDELGLWCAHKAADFLLNKDKTAIFEIDNDIVQISKELFLRESSQVLEAAISEGKLKPINTIEDVQGAVENGLLSPKVLLLVDCLLAYRDVKDVRCIVFVERVVTAMVLTKVASHIGCLSFLNCEFLAGITASLDVMGKKQQHRTMEQFCAGKVNVLMATNVAEEGLDVQSCSCVIRFDLPKSVRSFIQSRGRARKPGSDYVIFLERNNQKQEDLVLNLIQSEESMKAQALNRTHPIHMDTDPVEGMEFYRVEKTGATVNTDSSISKMHCFCSKLPGDKYYSPQPEFRFESIEGEDGFVCKLILPPNGPFRELIGPPRRSVLLAKQSVCLEACKKLHHMGQLTDYLLPVTEKVEEEQVMNLGGKNVSGAGTTKRKELHPTEPTAALYGDWINSKDGRLLQAYVISFTVKPKEDDLYSDFVLLLNTSIDDDVANTEIPMFLTKNRVAKARISAAGECFVSAAQLKEAKAYHELVFNGMFGKLMIYDKKKMDGGFASSKMKNLLASRNLVEGFWIPSCMYLVLPLLAGNITEELDRIPIDWNAIRDCAVTAQAFEGLANVCNHGDASTSPNRGWIGSSPVTESEGIQKKDILHMASGPMPISKVRGMAVITIHTGKVYSVVEVLKELNADCPMVGLQDSIYPSYTDYFKRKYGKVLQFPQQALLQLKQTHRPHNLLTKQTTKSSGNKEKINQPALVEIPPELCFLVGISNSIVRSLYLFPSVMHRFDALLLSAQLRFKIAKHMPQCASIAASQVMEALTTRRCLEGFSFEALESLGDSFLKYAASRYLFLVYQNKHEGQLSARRSRAICNATLHRLAAAHDLPGYIRDEPFDPGHWFAPGMLCRKHIPCKCNLNNITCVEEIEKNEEFKTETVFRIGKSCNEGHRWICSKTIADTVEALIGAFLVGGTGTALDFMKWIGMEIEFDMSLVKTAMERSAIHPSILQGFNITGLETQLDYVFGNKSLLIEAVTHASQQDPHGGCCYQRLEFLGDATLDFLITHHLFSAHPGLSPGILSDLRSAAVNNECFARSAVKHNLQKYLRHGSGELLSQITNFVKNIQIASKEHEGQVFGWEGVRGPKVLGDLIESITGAILVDSGFDLERVWTVMKPLLSPIVTPLTLPLHPIRELSELAQYKGFPFCWKEIVKEGNKTVATAEVKLQDELIIKTARAEHKKTAQKEASKQVLLALREKGLSHPRRHIGASECTTVYRDAPPTSSDMKQDVLNHGGDIAVEKGGNIALCIMKDDLMDDPADEKRLNLPEGKNSSGFIPTAKFEQSADCTLRKTTEEFSDVAVEGVAVADKDTSGMPVPGMLGKGGGRSSLHEYCHRHKWKAPVYEMSNQEGEPHSKRFTFSVEIFGPPFGPIKIIGDPMSSKKQAMDNVAVKVLLSLKDQP